ncbi:hypothetical protein BCR42DRAFT_395553 [Absidia repens]|uniref:Uncharacterized protein n=1 Tax=Absidia repens TaxID=90262 RepID=A0A1X2I745_9FUNG|nr:hypothetical protein BCR42DRAFT_395553 [Absidia repens]
MDSVIQDEIRKAYTITGVQVWTNQNTRARSDDGSVNDRARKRPAVAGPSTMQQGGVTDAEMATVDKAKTKKKRAPPKKIAVEVEEYDIWKQLKNVDAGMNMAQVLSLYRKSATDVQAGLRYLYARKPKKEKGKATMMVNQVFPATVASDDSDDIDNTDSADDFSELESDDEQHYGIDDEGQANVDGKGEGVFVVKGFVRWKCCGSLG